MPTEPADLTDAELWAQCRQGRQAAWAVLVRRYQRLIYTVPRRAGLNEEAAADVFQFAFAQLFQSLDRLDDPSRLRAWLVTTAKRESLRLLALSRRVVELRVGVDGGDEDGAPAQDPIERIADDAPLPEALLEGLQQQHALRRAVERLDPPSRAFVEAMFLQDEAPAYSELAARLGIPEGSIGPTRARCIAKLRALMQP